MSGRGTVLAAFWLVDLGFLVVVRAIFWGDDGGRGRLY